MITTDAIIKDEYGKPAPLTATSLENLLKAMEIEGIEKCNVEMSNIFKYRAELSQDDIRAIINERISGNE